MPGLLPPPGSAQSFSPASQRRTSDGTTLLLPRATGEGNRLEGRRGGAPIAIGSISQTSYRRIGASALVVEGWRLVAVVLCLYLGSRSCFADSVTTPNVPSVTLEAFLPQPGSILAWGKMVPISARIVATSSPSESVTYRALLAVNGHPYHAYQLQLLPGDAVVRTTIIWYVDVRSLINRVDFKLRQSFPSRKVTQSAGALRILYWGRPRLKL